MVDKTIIQRKLADLDTYLGQIDQYAGVSLEAYRSDWKTQRIVDRTLQMMIETCADIANHILSDGGMRAPTSYADTFKALHENVIMALNYLPIWKKWRSSAMSSCISTKASTPGLS